MKQTPIQKIGSSVLFICRTNIENDGKDSSYVEDNCELYDKVRLIVIGKDDLSLSNQKIIIKKFMDKFNITSKDIKNLMFLQHSSDESDIDLDDIPF